MILDLEIQKAGKILDSGAGNGFLVCEAVRGRQIFTQQPEDHFKIALTYIIKMLGFQG